jgi:glycosidase
MALLASLVLVAVGCDAGGQTGTSQTTSGTGTTSTTEGPAPDPTTTTAAPAQVGITAPVVRLPPTGEVIYFVMTDRFDNGDPANDTGGQAGGTADADVLRHGFLPTDSGYYHGGDVAGLDRRLDYLAELGINAIWVTPPFTNRAVQGNGTVGGSSAGYHGYWQVDYTNIDPHLGVNDEMRAFVEAAHNRDIRVYFDAVVNHTGDVIIFEEDSVAYRPKEAWPFRDAGGEAFDDRDHAGGGDFPDLDASTSFAYTPTFALESDAATKAPAWLNDPIHYHNRGNSTFSGESSLYGDFFGLDDLFTAHPEVVAGMTDIYGSAIEAYGVDGFRVDTVKHVNDEFWDAFIPAIDEAARAGGDDDLFVFGEVFSSDPLLRSHYTTNGPFPAVLDFGFSDATIAYVANGGSAAGLADLFEDDDWYTDADSNASMLVKFVGNHDMGRLGGFVSTANSGANDAELLRRMQLAMELMFTSRGVPSVYYGDEQGFVGEGGDKGARQDMFPSRVASYNDDDLIGTDATTADDNFDPEHPMYTLIAQLAELRRAHPALETGAHVTRHAEREAGVYAFSRVDRDERVEYVVAVNNAAESRTVGFDVYTPSASFAAIYPADTPSATSAADGLLELTVPPLGAVVYRAEAPVPSASAAPLIAIEKPDESAQVGFDRFRIEAALDRGAYSEVTFAVAVDGGEFEIVGTDDAPPYRVFWDRTHLPAGSRVELMATVDDLSGHQAAATSSFTLG